MFFICNFKIFTLELKFANKYHQRQCRNNQVERFEHSKKKLQKKNRAIKKQTRIARAHGFPTGPEHRLSKLLVGVTNNFKYNQISHNKEIL